MRKKRLPLLLSTVFIGVFLTIMFFLLYTQIQGSALEYVSVATSTRNINKISTSSILEIAPSPEKPLVAHIPTPEPLRGVYMTSCIASMPSLRKSIVDFIKNSELNAVIIDIKDYTGMISFDAMDDRFVLNRNGCFVRDMQGFIASLHAEGIYVIGRVAVMQDTEYPKKHPDTAVKSKRTGGIWKDRKGLSFIDPGADEYWQYMVDLGKASHAIGFDEINYDYIRFPSDGDMADAVFIRTGSTSKPIMMARFYKFLGDAMRRESIPISADIFGMTTTNTDDLGIGQILEDALMHFDYVAPMVYPSHYPPNFNGWPDPNDEPYGVIKFSMDKAVLRAHKMEEREAQPLSTLRVGATSTTATSTDSVRKFVPTGKYSRRLRPWIQDFDYGKDYTKEDIIAQKKAVYDSGLTSWMTWDPANKYTRTGYGNIIEMHDGAQPQSSD